MDGVEEVPEGVRHGYEPAHLVQRPAQLCRLADAGQVSLQPDGDHVAHIRRNFHAAAYEQPAPLPELLQHVRLPHPVVLRDVDARQPDPSRLFDQLVGRERRIGGPAHRVHMHIDDSAGHQ